MKGDTAAARVAFTAARVKQEELLRTRRDYGPFLMTLGLIDAGLARKEDAIREGRLAVELTSKTNDPFDVMDVLYIYAQICAWAGERDLAVGQLQSLAKTPGGPTYGDLRLSPNWDSLRGDPRFQKMVDSLAPK
jgi:hypothetical protein